MPKKIVECKEATISAVKEFLEKLKESVELSPMQRVTLDYASKLAKLPSEKAEALVSKLVEEFKLSRFTAVQIANILPQTIEELRTLLVVEGRIFLTSELEKMLSIIKEFSE
ncbi:MAG: RNA polymerase Rpb4 [Candidatus Methanomethylicota archaeon]|uniref:DNA-directed RNA polymerase subunit Rpo4 n=1 Tax=Thermoproteota archaeon TaxID=2056631 RepID=A0A497EXJ5_9CREN|nr:MAG: RNA polymerase Rpb4 [Candidatus Verstraetearchaeota archaeon]